MKRKRDILDDEGGDDVDRALDAFDEAVDEIVADLSREDYASFMRSVIDSFSRRLEIDKKVKP